MTPQLKVGDRTWKKMGSFPYEVSNDGEVRSLKTGKILKGTVNSGGYRTFSTIKWENGKRVQGSIRHHHAVMACFVGPRPSGMVVNHKNAIKTDNRLENLEYCTPRENREHAKALHLYSSGERCPWSKLTVEKVLLAKKAREIGLSFTQLARAFEVSKKAIQQALSGKSWTYALESAQTLIEVRKP